MLSCSIEKRAHFKTVGYVSSYLNRPVPAVLNSVECCLVMLCMLCLSEPSTTMHDMYHTVAACPR